MGICVKRQSVTRPPWSVAATNSLSREKLKLFGSANTIFRQKHDTLLFFFCPVGLGWAGLGRAGPGRAGRGSGRRVQEKKT